MATALAGLPSIPGQPRELVAEAGYAFGRDIRILTGGDLIFGAFERGQEFDVIWTPRQETSSLAWTDKVLHHLGHFLMGHDQCFRTSSPEQAPLTGDALLQEEDASTFASCVVARYWEIQRATRTSTPTQAQIRGALVFGGIQSDWPKRLTERHRT